MATKILYFPPTWGKSGSNPADWPGGKLPATTSEAVNLGRSYAVQINSSYDGLPIYSPTGPVPVATSVAASKTPLTIDITGGAGTYTPESWFNRNLGVIVMGGAVLFFILAANMNPSRNDDY